MPTNLFIRQSAHGSQLTAQAPPPPLRAVEHICRMRGGSQPHLMRCSDGNYYVVKLQGNPQGTRTLVNEFLGTRLAGRLGLPIAINHVVVVPEELIRYSEGMVFELPRGSTPCKGGLCFGSRLPVDPRQGQTTDLLSASLFSDLENIPDFCGMLVFDKWTCNTDGRQAVFFRKGKNLFHSAIMIDQGFCFNAGEWNFPDAPRRSLYFRPAVYEQVRGIESFEPWLTKLESEIGVQVLLDIAKTIPPEWYEFDLESLRRLLEQLDSRRGRVRELLCSARRSSPNAFPNWREANGIGEENNHTSKNCANVVTFSRSDHLEACRRHN